MRAYEDVDFAEGEPRENVAALAAALAAGEDRHLHAGGGGQRRDGVEMLAGENLGRRHECGLTAAFDHRGACQQSDHGLARSHIALQQPQHALGPGKIGDDFSQGACLRWREGIGQGVDQRFAHMS